MAKLTKLEAKNHAAALALLAKEKLSIEECEFVFDHFHEGANHVNGSAGAFFTPRGLANDFGIDCCGLKVVDMCAGIGMLSWALHNYKHKPNCQWNGVSGEAELKGFEYTCIEINPAYVEIGRKLFPQATWICGDALDPATYKGLPAFDLAISNPPFSKINTSTAAKGKYTGCEFELKIMEQASRIADQGVFILPAMSSPFIFSGRQAYRDVKDGKAAQFMAQVGAHLEPGCGVDTAYYKDDWKGVSPIVEIVLANFEACKKDPDAALRRLWTEQGVSPERQAEVLADVEAKATPAAIAKIKADLFPDYRKGSIDLTPAGEQLVIPGAERIEPASKGTQLNLW